MQAQLARRSPTTRDEEADPLDTTADVETPEHVRFRYRTAGPARRAAAYLVDLMVRAVIISVFGFLALIGGASLGEEGIGGVGIGLLLTLYFLVEWFYYVVSETLMGGRSLGKRALRLRVVKQSGVPLSFSDSLLRNLLRGA
ncbi:MAG: RDD family protein, partial [Myxococcales bacterium]|nr:RDD family protein [Myxococcales bacterium]